MSGHVNSNAVFYYTRTEQFRWRNGDEVGHHVLPFRIVRRFERVQCIIKENKLIELRGLQITFTKYAIAPETEKVHLFPIISQNAIF